jgi:hypothetical protein
MTRPILVLAVLLIALQSPSARAGDGPPPLATTVIDYAACATPTAHGDVPADDETVRMDVARNLSNNGPLDHQCGMCRWVRDCPARTTFPPNLHLPDQTQTRRMTFYCASQGDACPGFNTCRTGVGLLITYRTAAKDWDGLLIEDPTDHDISHVIEGTRYRASSEHAETIDFTDEQSGAHFSSRIRAEYPADDPPESIQFAPGGSCAEGEPYCAGNIRTSVEAADGTVASATGYVGCRALMEATITPRCPRATACVKRQSFNYDTHPRILSDAPAAVPSHPHRVGGGGPITVDPGY